MTGDAESTLSSGNHQGSVGCEGMAGDARYPTIDEDEVLVEAVGRTVVRSALRIDDVDRVAVAESAEFVR